MANLLFVSACWLMWHGTSCCTCSRTVSLPYLSACVMDCMLTFFFSSRKSRYICYSWRASWLWVLLGWILFWKNKSEYIHDLSVDPSCVNTCIFEGHVGNGKINNLCMYYFDTLFCTLVIGKYVLKSSAVILFAGLDEQGALRHPFRHEHREKPCERNGKDYEPLEVAVTGLFCFQHTFSLTLSSFDTCFSYCLESTVWEKTLGNANRHNGNGKYIHESRYPQKHLQYVWLSRH